MPDQTLPRQSAASPQAATNGARPSPCRSSPAMHSTERPILCNLAKCPLLLDGHLPILTMTKKAPISCEHDGRRPSVHAHDRWVGLKRIKCRAVRFLWPSLAASIRD